MTPLKFHSSEALTLGVELELQLIDRRDGNLARAASDLLRLVNKKYPDLDIKLEITESMIEVATHIQRTYQGMLGELQILRNVLCESAEKLDIAICGGGTHPFQHWAERRIADRPRFHELSATYGYLAQQFTVFGQHVHIGCPDGDTAIALLHGLSRYIPHFIALAASSPFQQGTDTAFDCSRMNTIASFPLSGRIPFVKNWAEFLAYYERMQALGIIKSMKDFYWDIRPKPEYGTVEIRVFDTPLTVQRAASLAIYAQAIARLLMKNMPSTLNEDVYLVYGINRFQACRFGLEGQLIDPADREKRSIADDIRRTLQQLNEQFDLSNAQDALDDIRHCLDRGNHASWMRKELSPGTSLEGLVNRQIQAFESGRAHQAWQI
jgi:carboxylate-amine ligase